MARPRKPKELQTGHLTVIDGQKKKAAEDEEGMDDEIL